MRPPSRSLLRRPPWLSKHKSRSPLPVKQARPAQPGGAWRPQDVRKSDLELQLEQETGRAFPPPAASTILGRATALRVTEFLRAREESLHIRCFCPRGKRMYLSKFNRCLLRADVNPKDRENAKELWKLYIKLQSCSPEFLRALSTRAWDILWATQSLRAPAEPKIASHLIQLAQDMRMSGHRATFDQRMIHIETLFGRGSREEAIKEWNLGYMTGNGRTEDSFRPEYLDLGIRMYAVAGDPTQARDLLIELFATYPDWNPRLIFYVFDAYVAEPDRPGRHRQAWVLYGRLKQLLGDDMTLEDYERCYLGFLRAGSRTRALEVLPDLLQHGPKLRDSYGYKAKVEILRMFRNIAAGDKDADQINEVFLNGLVSLPSGVRREQFFTEWIRLLTKWGHADAAAQVVELMFERGTQPRASHLNAVIDAWIRTENPDLVQRAETMSLQMIVERITKVLRRNRPSDPTPRGPPGSLQSEHRLFLRRSLPAATSDTCELLARIYLMKGDRQKLVDLHSWQTRSAKLRTNTTALNAEMSFYLQRGYLPEVWRTFKREVMRQGKSDLAPTPPDRGTFSILWEASRMKPRTLTRSNLYRLGGHTSFPPPAIILRHTVSWLAFLRLSKPRRQYAQLLARVAKSGIPSRIMTTFCAWNDVAGALVALHLLARRLAAPPSQENVLRLARVLARLAFRRAARTPRRRRELNASPALAHNLERVLRALRALIERRVAARDQAGEGLGGSGGGDEEEERRNEIFLDALSELVRAVLIRSGAHPREVEGRIEGVKRAVGVEELRVGDKSAWDVAREMRIRVD